VPKLNLHVRLQGVHVTSQHSQNEMWHFLYKNDFINAKFDLQVRYSSFEWFGKVEIQKIIFFSFVLICIRHGRFCQFLPEMSSIVQWSLQELDFHFLTSLDQFEAHSKCKLKFFKFEHYRKCRAGSALLCRIFIFFRKIRFGIC